MSYGSIQRTESQYTNGILRTESQYINGILRTESQYTDGILSYLINISQMVVHILS